MANTNETGNAFIREVDEEYRREKLGTYWARYGRWLLVGVAALLIAVAGWLQWRRVQADRANERAQQFAQALSQTRGGAEAAKKAQGTLAQLETAPEPGYRALALLERAGAAATAGDSKGAAALYNKAASNTDLAKPFRDLATLKATQIEFDTMAPQAVIDRLKSMALPGNPWFGTAGELTALAQMKAGRPELARPLFEALAKEESVPPSIRGRAQQLAAAMTPVGAPASAAPALPGAPAK